jgi:hypothetical protein
MTDTELADDIGLYGMTLRLSDAVSWETKAAGLEINVAKSKMVRGDLVDLAQLRRRVLESNAWISLIFGLLCRVGEPRH